MGENIIIREIKREGRLYEQVLNLRNEVLRIPLGLDLFKEDLSLEQTHIILAAVTSSSKPLVVSGDKGPLNTETDAGSETQEKVVGCVLLAPYPADLSTCKLRHMAVATSCQGQGLGSKLIRSAEEYAKEQGKTRIYLHSRKYAMNFYMKLGYKLIDGKEFLESGIPHLALDKIIL